MWKFSLTANGEQSVKTAGTLTTLTWSADSLVSLQPLKPLAAPHTVKDQVRYGFIVWNAQGMNLISTSAAITITGSVEVFADGQWGTICEDGWDINDAHVICRQLGFPSAIKAFSSATHGQGSGQIWIHSLECTGNESHIYECSHNDYNCDHSGDASVECSSIIPWWHELHRLVIPKGYIIESPQ